MRLKRVFIASEANSPNIEASVPRPPLVRLVGDVLPPAANLSSRLSRRVMTSLSSVIENG